MDRSRVVVGVDGSPPSIAALRWAATEASLRDVDLEVLTSYLWRTPPGGQAGGQAVRPGGGPGPAGDREGSGCEGRRRPEGTAAEIAEAAVQQARAITRDVHGRTVPGHPAPALLAAARDAGLTVVGNRGRGGFRSLLLGSVSVQVTTHAPGPVAVVRGACDEATGPIVVGYDGSPEAEIALAMAFEEAAVRRRGTLVVVTAYQAPLPPWPAGAPPLVYDEELREAELHRDLLRHLAGWREKYPDVTVECVVARGSAAGALTERSRAAQLVVVGTRGRGGFDGLLLGSVGLQLLHHCDCPVLIARAHRAPTPAGQTADDEHPEEVSDGQPTEPGGAWAQHRQESPPVPDPAPVRAG